MSRQRISLPCICRFTMSDCVPRPDQGIAVRDLSIEVSADIVDVAAQNGGVLDRKFGADDLLIQPVHVPSPGYQLCDHLKVATHSLQPA